MESTREEASKKRKYDSDASKRRLMAAAIDVFAKAGFNGATTRMIARKAKVNESLIHRYFESKLGLFMALFKRFHENFTMELPYAPCESLEDELRHFFDFRMELSRRERKFLKLGLSQAIVDRKVAEEVSKLHRQFPSALKTRIEQLHAAGKIDPLIPVDYFTLLVSAVGFAMSMFRDIVFKYDDETIEHALEVASKVLARGASPPR